MKITRVYKKKIIKNKEISLCRAEQNGKSFFLVSVKSIKEIPCKDLKEGKSLFDFLIKE